MESNLLGDKSPYGGKLLARVKTAYEGSFPVEEEEEHNELGKDNGPVF